MRIVPDFLPQAFGGLFITFALILTLAPYLAGHDFGILKVPEFGARSRNRLRWLGPLALLAAIFLHVPLGQKMCDEPTFAVVADAKLCGTTKEPYVVTPARPKTCRDPDFGQEGWAHTEIVERSSGWRSGGFSQSKWCQDVLGGFLRDRSISSYSHRVLDKGEKHDKDWKGHVTYKYKGSVPNLVEKEKWRNLRVA